MYVYLKKMLVLLLFTCVSCEMHFCIFNLTRFPWPEQKTTGEQHTLNERTRRICALACILWPLIIQIYN